MATREFIKALEDIEVNVLFNRASTSYVSGISYGYEGIIIEGAKIGNDFKWGTIKDSINYEQERDRPAIHQANDTTRSLNPDAGTGDGHSARDSRAVQQGRTKQQPLFKRPKGVKFHDARSSKQSPDSKRPVRSTEREDDNIINIVPKKSKGVDLAALLDGHSHGNIVHADHQPDLDNPHLKRKRKKKKRRRM